MEQGKPCSKKITTDFNMDKLLEQALIYLDLGWYIFPCREKPGSTYLNKLGKLKISKEKSPYTKYGFQDASNDKSQIKEWWNKWNNACIGISCQQSNLFLIDIDVKNGRRGIDNYMQMGISDNGALHSRTPSKGLHVLFSGKGKSSTNTVTGVDTRGDGGYFIAPPSEIVGGIVTGKYVFLDTWDHTPVEINIFDLEKLHTQITKKDVKKKSFVNNLSTAENLIKVKNALEKLPMRMCSNYYEWIEIGMSLYELGDDGLILWREWSKKSDKYEDGVCEEKWDTFEPSEITLGSLFYYSKDN